jgi:hypothetical protein
MIGPPGGDHLPEARVGRRADRRRLVRSLAIAVVVGVVAGLAGWLWVVIAVGLVGLVAASTWYVARLSAEKEAGDRRSGSDSETPAPEGVRVYRVRPHALAVVVLLATWITCIVLVRSPELIFSELGVAVALGAVVFGALTTFAFVMTAIVRPRIRVTDTHVDVPKGRQVVSIPLEYVRLRIWGSASAPILEISAIGEYEYDFGQAVLGEKAFRELVAVLERRTGKRAVVAIKEEC